MRRSGGSSSPRGRRGSGGRRRGVDAGRSAEDDVQGLVRHPLDVRALHVRSVCVDVARPSSSRDARDRRARRRRGAARRRCRRPTASKTSTQATSHAARGMPREHVGDVVDVQDDAARADHEAARSPRSRATGGARKPVTAASTPRARRPRCRWPRARSGTRRTAGARSGSQRRVVAARSRSSP